MDALQDDETFVDFGPDPFYPYDLSPLERVEAKRLEQLRVEVRENVPRVPGVYGMIDRHQRLIYVGKSKSLRSRLLSYFMPANADDKQGHIVEAARQIVWERQPSEFAALLREQQLIRRWTPRWNVQGIPKRQRPVYLCLGRAPATFFLNRLPLSDAVACEGPFHGQTRMARVVDTLNQYFRLRDCGSKQTMRYADQLDLFDREDRPGCLRYEIGTCSGPCVGACSRAAYQRQVLEGQSFLEGMNAEPLVMLQERIEAAAARQQYELAMRLRDDQRAMEYLHRKLTMLSQARRTYQFVYAPPAPTGRSVWYLIARGSVVDALAAPQCPASYAVARQRLRQWSVQLESCPEHDHQYSYSLPLVAAWFRKHPEQLERTVHPSQAGRRYRAFNRSA